MDESLVSELQEFIETETKLDEVVIRNLSFDPDDILERLSDPKQQYRRGTKGRSGYSYSRSKDTGRWAYWPKTDQKDTESKLCNYLNEVAEKVRQLVDRPQSSDDLVYSSEYKDCGPPKRFRSDMKPSLVVLPRSMVREGAEWRDFRSHACLRAPGRPKAEEQHQLAEYAGVCFGTRWDRRYVLALCFHHRKLTPYFFDRSGAMHSSEYDIDENPQMFLRLAIGILFMDYAQLGYDTSFSMEQNACYLSIEGDKYKVERSIYLDSSIHGQGSVCLKVKCTDGKNEGRVCVVKGAWVDRSRSTKEVDMLKFLNGKVTNIPELIAGDVVRILDDSGRGVVDSTEIFRKSPFNVEIRDHYRIVMTPYGVPLREFASLTELLSATLDVVKGIEALDKIGVLHRDISYSNIVLVGDRRSGNRKGYIIDFDSAIHADVSAGGRTVGTRKRTGTVPFMAVDVLSNTDHTVIHDVESMFYVLLWAATSQAGSNGLKRSFADDFNFRVSLLCAWNPEGLLTKGRRILDKMDPYFKPLKKCLSLLRIVFFPPPIDEEVSLAGYKGANKDTQRSSAEIFSQLKEILDQSMKEVTEEEQTKGVAAARLLTLEEGGKPKSVVVEAQEPECDVDFIGSMKRHEYEAIGGASKGTSVKAEHWRPPAPSGRPVRRSSRIKCSKLHNVKVCESSSTKKRSRATDEDRFAEGTRHPLMKKRRASLSQNGQIDD